MLANCALTNVCVIAGVVWILHNFLPVICHAIRRVFSSRSRDLTELGKWAIVTGATDGIGKEIAIKLAKRGLSIVLISRSNDRLSAVEKEIKSLPEYRGEVRSLVVDFSLKSTDYEHIGSELGSLDVALLVNNVGVSYHTAQYYNELQQTFIDGLIDVNIRPTFQLTRIVIAGMYQRKRGAIICISSGAATLQSHPLYAGYAGVKAAIEAFCRSLQVEASSYNVAVQCYVPLLVTSKLSKIKKPSLTVPTASSFADDALWCMEHVPLSAHPTLSPYLIHEAMMSICNAIPRILWNNFYFKKTKAIRNSYMKKISEKKVN